MIRRCMPPVHSELDARALWAGARTLFARPHADSIKQKMLESLRCEDVLFTDSGTSALRLAIEGAVLHTKRPVALPAYACYDVAAAAVGAGAGIVFYDVDPETLAPDESSVVRALQLEPAAIVVVHSFGLPVNVGPIVRLAQHVGAIVIEDAAQSAFATFRGVPLGSTGSVGIFSFGRGKGLTGGAGGALCGNDERGVIIQKQARDALRRSDAGARIVLKSTAQWLLGRPALYGIPSSIPMLRLGETLYHEPAPPHVMTRASRAMLDSNWDASLRTVPVRRTNALRLKRVAAGTGWLTLETIGEPSYLRLPLLMPSVKDHVDRRARRLGIMRGYPIPLPSLSQVRSSRVAQRESFAGAQFLADRLITLPTHRLLEEGDLRRLEDWLRGSVSAGTESRSRGVRAISARA